MSGFNCFDASYRFIQPQVVSLIRKFLSITFNGYYLGFKTILSIPITFGIYVIYIPETTKDPS